MQCGNLLHVRLIYIVEAAEMHPADMQSADAHGRVWQRLEFERQAGLNAVGVLMILHEPHNHRRSEKRARRNRDARPGGRPGKWGNRRRVRVSTAVEQLAHRKIRKHRRTGKREQLGLGVQTIFKRASGVLTIVELRDIGSAAA